MNTEKHESSAEIMLGVLQDMRGHWVGSAFLYQVTGSDNVPLDVEALRQLGHTIEYKTDEQSRRIFYRLP